MEYQEIRSSLNACFNSNAVVLVIWSRLGKGGSGISDKEFKICVIIRSARLNLTRVSELICPVFSEDLFDTLHHDQPMSDRIALSLAPTTPLASAYLSLLRQSRMISATI